MKIISNNGEVKSQIIKVRMEATGKQNKRKPIDKKC